MGHRLGPQGRGWGAGGPCRSLCGEPSCVSPSPVPADSPATDARQTCRAISARGDWELPPGSLKNRGVIEAPRPLPLHGDSDMISGEARAPRPPSPHKHLSLNSAGQQEGSEATTKGSSSCPQSPFWEQQGVWPLTQVSVTLLPGAVVATTQGSQKPGGRERSGDAPHPHCPAWPFCPGPAPAASTPISVCGPLP